MAVKKKRILFFHTHLSSFVKKDISFLSEAFCVIPYEFKPTNKKLVPVEFVKQFIVLIRHMFKSNIYVCQFASYHSFLPALFARLTGKKCYIIIGGMDAVSFPSFSYGNYSKFLLGTFTRWSIKLCQHLLPKHASLMHTKYEYERSDYSFQGVKQFNAKLNTPYTIIFNGYNSEKWKRNAAEKKPNLYITVTSGLNYPFQQKLKGIDLILEIAPLHPECMFWIIGVSNTTGLPPEQPNVKYIPPVKNEELVDYYSKATYYMQLSMAEGFPNALCEAMLCECVPIVSGVFSMPDIIGDSGYVLADRNTGALATLIAQTQINPLEMVIQQGKNARKRIAENYTEQRRKEELMAIIGNK